MVSDPSRRSSSDFLDQLRAFESGIDPSLHAWYRSNLQTPVLDYPLTSAPGRLVRDCQTGAHITRSLTVEEYFSALGVLEFFDRDDPASLTTMQYRSVNPWGFVGYQIGEEILVDTGHYKPASAGSEIDGETHWYPRIHRGGLPVILWSGGITEKFLAPRDGGPILATDVNRWEGRFTGRHGIFSLEDLMDAEKQEAVIRDIISHNLRNIDAGLRATGTSINDCLELTWTYKRLDMKPSYVNCSISGISASCHLCGSDATLDLLNGSKVAEDELGTSALDYMARFGNYDLADILHCLPDISADLCGVSESRGGIDA